MIKNIKKSYKHCIRCGSVGMFTVDFGKVGKLWLCPICWTGLAACMHKDFKLYLNDNVDMVKELSLATQREKWFKENNK